MCTIISTHVLSSMRILPSSPYAAFVAKDWHSAINSSNSMNPASAARIKKRYFKNFVKFEIQETSDVNLKKTESIQLSFA